MHQMLTKAQSALELITLIYTPEKNYSGQNFSTLLKDSFFYLDTVEKYFFLAAYPTPLPVEKLFFLPAHYPSPHLPTPREN